MFYHSLLLQAVYKYMYDRIYSYRPPQIVISKPNYGTSLIVRYVILLFCPFSFQIAFLSTTNNSNFEFIISLGKVTFHARSLLGAAYDGSMSLSKIFAFASKTRKFRL